MMYLVDGVFELNRAEFEEKILDYCLENDIKCGDLCNLLVTTSLERNIKHHPLRIARELGWDVVVLH